MHVSIFSLSNSSQLFFQSTEVGTILLIFSYLFLLPLSNQIFLRSVLVSELDFSNLRCTALIYSSNRPHCPGKLSNHQIVLIDSCTLSSTELALIYTMVGIQMAFSFSEFISVIMQYDFYFKKRIKTERLARKEEAEVERQYDLNKGEDEFAF